MNHGLWSLGILFAVGACNGTAATTEDAGGGDKAAFEAAATELKQPVALIAAYQPYLRAPDGKDIYSPKRRPELDRAGAAAAGEIRFAANGARQKIKTTTPALKDLEGALSEISKACTDATEAAAFDVCNASVVALDASLGKAGAAASAAGATTKFPRVTPDAITDEAKKAMTSFLKVLGPSPVELAYAAKRADASAAFTDVFNACQAALDDVSQVTSTFEHADEPIRLIAVTHKMSFESQCHILTATDSLRNDLAECKKKPKSADCKVTCSKVRTRIDDGIPAAVFTPLAADADKICEK